MELVRWRWRAVAGVLLMAALLFWAMVTFLGEPQPARPATLASAVNSSSSLPSFPLEFPDITRPLQEALQELGSEPVPGSVVEDNPVKSPATGPVAPKAATKAAKTTSPSADSAAGTDSGLGPDITAGSSSDRSSDPVKDFDTGFENPSTFGPDEPKPEAIPDPPEEPEPEPERKLSVAERVALQTEARRASGIRSGDTGNNGADGSSQAATDTGDSEEGEAVKS